MTRDSMMDLYRELEWRGMLSESTEGVREALLAAPLTSYIGFDPTASSLHVGSLLTVMGLAAAGTVTIAGEFALGLSPESVSTNTL